MASRSDAQPPLRLQTVVVIVGALVAAVVAWRLNFSAYAPEQSPVRLVGALPLETAAVAQRSPGVVRSSEASQRQFVSPSRTWLPDEVGSAHDLKRVFDAHIESTDLRLRQIAVRAFAACAPTFLPRPGETPSPDALIGALPQAMRAEREAAYRSLYARCASLLGMGREKLNGLQRGVMTSDSSREVGARAQSDLAAGNDDVANQRVSQALASGDPATIASLAGVAEAWARRGSATPTDPKRLAAARDMDAALPWVACDLGMACGNDSLLALQACAIQGQCSGDVPQRLTGAGPSDPADRRAIQAQRERLLKLLNDGRALTMADLVP